MRARPRRAPPVRREPGDGVAVEGDGPAPRRDEAGDGVDQRRLPGAVGSDETDDRPARHAERDAVDGAKAAEGHDELANVEERRVLPVHEEPTSPRRNARAVCRPGREALGQTAQPVLQGGGQAVGLDDRGDDEADAADQDGVPADAEPLVEQGRAEALGANKIPAITAPDIRAIPPMYTSATITNDANTWNWLPERFPVDKPMIAPAIPAMNAAAPEREQLRGRQAHAGGDGGSLIRADGEHLLTERTSPEERDADPDEDGHHEYQHAERGPGKSNAFELRMLRSMPKIDAAGILRPVAPPVKSVFLNRNASSATAAANVSTARCRPRVRSAGRPTSTPSGAVASPASTNESRERHAPVVGDDPEREAPKAGQRQLGE